MPTSWKISRAVEQYAETEHHIEWNGVANFSGFAVDRGCSIMSSADLLHISNFTANDLKMKTWYLIAKGFDFSDAPATVSGIEAKITTKRFGRITDDTVQLIVNGDTLGKNMATADLSEDKLYGSPTDLWGMPVFERSMLLMPNFGILLRFQSHPNWPHRCPIGISSVSVRVW